MIDRSLVHGLDHIRTYDCNISDFFVDSYLAKIYK